MRTLQDRVEAMAWRIYTSSLRDPAIGFDDLKQCGQISLISAQKHFDANRGASYETYALLCARTSMIDMVGKNRPGRVELTLGNQPVVWPNDHFMLMVDQIRRGALTPRARKLLEGTLRHACQLPRCTLRELRRYLGMTPREFSLARFELQEKLSIVSC